MALDPQVLPYVDVSPRVGRSLDENRPGIGLGAPQHFRFTPGMSMQGPDWQVATTNEHAGWSVTAQAGFMRFTLIATPKGWLSASTRQSFANTEGSVSIGFRLRVTALQNAPIQLWLAGGVILLLWPNGTAWYTLGAPTQPPVAFSGVRADGQWHDILISVTPTAVAVWEGDQQRFVQSATPGPSIAPVFTAVVVADLITDAMLDVSDLVVVSGTDKQVRPSRGLLDGADGGLTQASAMATAVQAQLPGLRDAATPLANILHSTNISWSDWFWGRDVDPAMQQGVNGLVADPRTQAYLNAVTGYQTAHLTPALSRPFTVCLSVGVTFSALVSVSGTVGLNINLTNGGCQLVTTASGGVAFNLSIGFGLEALLFPRGLPDALGWFFTAKATVGEGVNFGIGVAGGIPLQLPALGVAGNMGLTLGIGIGAGVLPVELAAGVSYTWPLS